MKLVSPPSHPLKGLSAERDTLRCGGCARGAERAALRAVTLASGGVPVLRLPATAWRTTRATLVAHIYAVRDIRANVRSPPRPSPERGAPGSCMKNKRCLCRAPCSKLDETPLSALLYVTALCTLTAIGQGVGLMTFVYMQYTRRHQLYHNFFALSRAFGKNLVVC